MGRYFGWGKKGFVVSSRNERVAESKKAWFLAPIICGRRPRPSSRRGGVGRFNRASRCTIRDAEQNLSWEISIGSGRDLRHSLSVLTCDWTKDRHVASPLISLPPRTLLTPPSKQAHLLTHQFHKTDASLPALRLITFVPFSSRLVVVESSRSRQGLIGGA